MGAVRKEGDSPVGGNKNSIKRMKGVVGVVAL